MQKKKMLIATIVTVTIFLSMFSAINLTRGVNDSSSFYTVANGNLNTDTYSQYPFEANNVSFGFSQFGELIGIAPGDNQLVQGNWHGMSYDGNDPFARNTPLIGQHQWINGWYLYISYIDPNEPNKDRNLWAFALFSDGHVAGGDWIINVTGTPTSPPYGGRKTNGMVVTDPLQVLYNGPREYIAQATNHIYDNDGTVQWPVVDLIITMIFDKVSKQVVLYKDVKVTIEKLNLWGKLDVQLSDREEYDLGPSPNFASYAHFYEEQGVTCYTPSWSIAQNLTTDYIEHQVGSTTHTINPDGSWTYTLHPPNSDPVSPDYMKVYIDGAFQDPSIQPAPYNVTYGTTTTVTFTTPPDTTSVLEFRYKYVRKSAESVITDGAGFTTSTTGVPISWTDQYDYAQVISSDNLFVAWAAFWPPTSSHTVDGILNFLQPFYNTRVDTLSSAPKRSPLIIGQWDIAMDPATLPMFRAVEVKGIANYHNAQDPQETGKYLGTTLDIEAHYQLDSVFTPYDLNSAITKNLNTWVDYHTITAANLLSPTLMIGLSQFPVHYVPIWETYNNQSERVFLNDVLQYPIRTKTGFDPTYELYTLGDGTGYIYFPDTTIFSKGDVIKIIYATDVCNKTNGFTLTSQTAFNVTTNGFNFGEGAGSLAMGANWEDTLDVSHNIDVEDFSGTFNNVTAAGNTTWAYSGGMVWEAKDFTVFKEDTTSLEIGSNNFATILEPANGSAPFYNMTMSLANLRIKWQITGPDDGTLFTDLKDVEVDHWDFFVNYTVTVKYFNNTSTGINYFNVSATLTFTPRWTSFLYKEEIPGRYEWGIVGTKAASVDSAGLAMITAALKDKEVEYGISGEDINDTQSANQMPWIFSPMSTGTSTPWSPYYYSTTDLRTGLKDDWDPVGYDWQIAGANLVGSGGPLANMLAYYGNDFTTAFYGLGQFTPYTPWNGAIVALSCWNSTAQKAHVDTNKYGYAVVSTFEDLNGTTGLLVWGNWGRDTYYAANWFYMDLIQEFQSFPCGATSIVLQIVYNTTTFKPKAFNVVEVLGTISETGIVDAMNTLPYVWDANTPPLKGGIHPDP
ncbi:MAG: hypothetical protein ABSD73_04120 [Candidatus Bathyarchaeia archaeon]